MTLREWLAIPGNTQQKLAEKIGVTQSAISQWLNWIEDNDHPNGVKLSAERALEIEAGTGGAVTRYELRPTVFGNAPKRRAAA